MKERRWSRRLRGIIICSNRGRPVLQYYSGRTGSNRPEFASKRHCVNRKETALFGVLLLYSFAEDAGPAIVII